MANNGDKAMTHEQNRAARSIMAHAIAADAERLAAYRAAMGKAPTKAGRDYLASKAAAIAASLRAQRGRMADIEA